MFTKKKTKNSLTKKENMSVSDQDEVIQKMYEIIRSKC